MTENNQKEAQEFRMQKMYIKDFSFESPNTPDIFLNQQQEPAVEINLQLNNKQINDTNWEIALKVTAKVTNKKDDKVLFILELEHAAIFLLKNIPEEYIHQLLGIDCPTMLFPFTRQIVSQVSTDGGFIPFLMEPVNFMALYQNAQKQKEQQKAQEE